MKIRQKLILTLGILLLLVMPALGTIPSTLGRAAAASPPSQWKYGDVKYDTLLGQDGSGKTVAGYSFKKTSTPGTYRNTPDASGNYRQVDVGNSFVGQTRGELSSFTKDGRVVGTVAITNIIPPDGGTGTDPGVGTVPGSGTSDGSEDGGQVADEDPCDASGDPLSWVICPVINMINGAIMYMQSVIDRLLEFDVSTVFERNCGNNCQSGDAYYAAWNSFRLVAIAVIVIAGLVMVITQALGLEVFDAYTVKKMVPRLFIAAIGISLSWYLLQFLANFTNDLGIAVRNMIYWPFRNIGNGDVGLNNPLAFLLGDVALGAGFLVLGLGGLLSLVATAGLAVLIAFLVLILRQIVLILLILLAPLAIALYVLPNTQKAYHLWWDSLAKGFMMFPIITAFIATGRVFSVVAANAGGDGVHGTANQIISLIAFFLPYFALPFTFRLAGGALATIGGLANDRSRGAFDRLKKYRGQKGVENMQAMRTGNRFRSDNFAANAFNRTSRGIANAPSAGAIPWKWKSRYQAGLANHEQSELVEYMEKNQAFAAIKNNDDYLQATMKNMGGGNSESDWRRYLSTQGYEGRALEQGVAEIRAAKRGVSNEVFDRAAVVANAATGTGWKEGGPAQMLESINEVSGADRHLASNMLGMMRPMAGQSGRMDLAGSGFGTQVKALHQMYDGKITAEKANEEILENAIFTKGPGEYARARGQAVQNMAPQMLKHLQNVHTEVTTARASGDQTRILNAERKLAQEYAALDNLHDSLNHMAPENARIIADSVLSQEVVPGVTVMNQLTRLQADQGVMGQAYTDTRKSYDARQWQANEGRPPEPPES
jgi:hypothetical protein